MDDSPVQPVRQSPRLAVHGGREGVLSAAREVLGPVSVIARPRAAERPRES